MLRKILAILIFSFWGLRAGAQDFGESDHRMLQYINQEKWFDAKSLYDSCRDDLSEVIRLISGAFLGTYFNKPADGIACAEELLSKYSGQLGEQAVMYRMLMAKSLASMRNYPKMDSVLTYILVHDSLYLDDQSRRAMVVARDQCREIARLPQLKLVNRLGMSRSTVDMELRDGLFFLDVDFCGENVKTLLDIGAEYTAIDQSLANELGVYIFQDSLQTTPASYVKMGIIDSMQIGSLTVKNEICYVFPDGLMARDRELGADSGITRLRAMLGISTLMKLSAVTIDVVQKTITFDTAEQPGQGIVNFMLKDHKPYLWLELNGIPAMMFWDTGMSARPQLSGKFYAEHAASFPELSPGRKGRHVTFEGVAEYDYRELNNIPVHIALQEVTLPELRVVSDLDKLNPGGVATYDGQMNNITEVRQIRIDFENMCVTIE